MIHDVWRVKRGEGLNRLIPVLKADKSPENLTGCTGSATARRFVGAPEGIAATVDCPAEGTAHVRVRIAQAVVGAMDPRRYMLDVYVHPPIGDPVAVASVVLIIEGST